MLKKNSQRNGTKKGGLDSTRNGLLDGEKRDSTKALYGITFNANYL